MNKQERAHQVANELGIVMGMIQLALRKMESIDSNQDSGSLRSYLERAQGALLRLKDLMDDSKELTDSVKSRS